MYCPTCNKAFPDNYAFCDSCGGKLANENTQVAPQQPVPPPVYSQNPVYQNPNPGYASPPVPGYPATQANDQVVSTWAWIGLFLLNLIPGIGPLIYIILIFVWAFGNPRKRTLKNYAKAMLIIALIAIILTVVFIIFLMPMLMDFLYENYDIDLNQFDINELMNN